MIKAILLLTILAAEIPQLDFEMSDACFPFHHSLGSPIYQLHEGAYALPCVQIGKTRREANETFTRTMRQHFKFSSTVGRGIGTHDFVTLESKTIPNEFYLMRLTEGPELPYKFGIDEHGILYVVWYSRHCDLQWDKAHGSTIIACSEDE